MTGPIARLMIMLHPYRVQWPVLALVAACGTSPDYDGDKEQIGSDSGGAVDFDADCVAPTLAQTPPLHGCRKLMVR